jgi:hypothetical protein
MPSLSSMLAHARRSLGGHLGRLGRSFDTLAEQVREAIARSIGRTVAEAVAEAVHVALADPPADPDLLPAPPRYPGRPPPLWDELDRRSWRDDADDLREPDRPRDSDADDERPWDEEDPDVPRPEDDAPPDSQARPWRRAVAAGCRAAAWWLERHPGRWSLVVAVSVGVVAGAAALVSGSPVIGGAGVAAAALGLLALVDAVHSGAALLADALPW